MLLLPDWARSAMYGAVAVLGIFVGIWIYGERKYVAGENHIKDLAAATARKVHVESRKITERIITEYVPKVEYIQEKTKTIIQKVPIYVTQTDDSHCTIPNAFAWLWNSANQVQFPRDPGPIPGGASDVVLSDVATQHAKEAGICLANEARIRATTEWLKEQKALYNR